MTMKRDELVEKIRQIINLIKNKAEDDDYYVRQPIILEIMDKDGHSFAMVFVETNYVRFSMIPEGVTSLADIAWVADLIKLGFRSNIMMIEARPESFKTAEEVRGVIKSLNDKQVNYDHISDITWNRHIRFYISRYLHNVDTDNNNLCVILDSKSGARWLMTPEEWKLLKP